MAYSLPNELVFSRAGGRRRRVDARQLIDFIIQHVNPCENRHSAVSIASRLLSMKKIFKKDGFF